MARPNYCTLPFFLLLVTTFVPVVRGQNPTAPPAPVTVMAAETLVAADEFYRTGKLTKPRGGMSRF